MVWYHQEVKRMYTGGVFHDEVGYWIWDANSKTIMRSFTIPRAVAGGFFTADDQQSPLHERQCLNYSF